MRSYDMWVFIIDIKDLALIWRNRSQLSYFGTYSLPPAVSCRPAQS